MKDDLHISHQAYTKSYCGINRILILHHIVILGLAWFVVLKWWDPKGFFFMGIHIFGGTSACPMKYNETKDEFNSTQNLEG